MILSDRELRARLERGELLEGGLPTDVQLQPASIDLRLGTTFAIYRTARMACIDPRDAGALEAITETLEIPDGEAFVLQAGEFALGATAEVVKVPTDLVARVEGRSSIGRLAVVVHATAGFIDPGFEGQITLEFANLGRCPVLLYPGMRISQLVFHQLTSPAERPYGSGIGSKYQGQRGPVPSRIGTDRK